jgi:hypothetical protein
VERIAVEGDRMKSDQFRYKGTKELVKIGDVVRLSKKYQKEYGSETGIVVDLRGFITVQINGQRVDFDARSVNKQ